MPRISVGSLSLYVMSRSKPLVERGSATRRPQPRSPACTEEGGLGAAALAAADVVARIAMAGGVDALNVATAAGIALHRLSGPRLTRS
jgi:hypothetical protein